MGENIEFVYWTFKNLQAGGHEDIMTQWTCAQHLYTYTTGGGEQKLHKQTPPLALSGFVNSAVLAISSVADPLDKLLEWKEVTVGTTIDLYCCSKPLLLHAAWPGRLKTL
jgi:hypothetical protein